MHPRHLFGVVTPSSNTVLEPLTSAMLADVPGASAHFSRFTVTQIALSSGALAQFDTAPMVSAARLLADAKVGVIGWSGTSASWLGFERDEALCAEIERATGAQACTSVLAINELLGLVSSSRFALVSPYTADVQRRIAQNYAKHGYEIVAEAHMGISDNYAFSDITEAQILAMCRQVATARPEAIVIMCTNMRGARLAPIVEAEFGIPLLDSTSAVVWKALKLLGADGRRVEGWGRLFSL
jgi:maleate isomerase